MFNTFPSTMRSSPFALAIFFAGFGAALAQAVPWLWLPYFFICIFLIFQAFMLAYVNERFTRYANTMMIGMVAMVAFLGVLAVFFLMKNEWGYPLHLALVSCFVFASVITAVYLWVSLTKASSFPFDVQKGRVVSLHVKVDRYSALVGG
ncbi:hypothetical protein [Pseudomonas eucalypticola]|uniref:Uncharacterized protein n=1 Tax=Pseudomonas eucalypticola TaxID=2599595 RepID=A0A7D5D3Z9_9PSED|nr:hypothetical protein [Pseudomonas eucalypticola]QKZ02399.1 hypothetical protein HWQ56_00760 [Pseudomonas eucalypticola]